MRLGSQPCVLDEQSKAAASYGAHLVHERHRHRYEFNPEYRRQFEAAGFTITGTNPDQNLPEIVEIPEHPWFVAVQFHPEFRSKPQQPHPLFAGFIEAAIDATRLACRSPFKPASCQAGERLRSGKPAPCPTRDGLPQWLALGDSAS